MIDSINTTTLFLLAAVVAAPFLLAWAWMVFTTVMVITARVLLSAVTSPGPWLAVILGAAAFATLPSV